MVVRLLSGLLIVAAFFAALFSIAPARAQSFIPVNEGYYSLDPTNGLGFDLTARIPRHVPLELTMPIDTTSWESAVMAACDKASYDTLFNIAIASPLDHVINFPANCQFEIDQATGNGWLIPDTADGIVTRGHADGLSAINWNPTDDPCADPGLNLCNDPDDAGFRFVMFQVGDVNSTPASIATWTWDTGFAYNTDLVGSSAAIDNVFPTDIIELEIPAWGVSGSTSIPDWDSTYTVVCAVHDDSTEEGVGCTGLPDNTIRLDRVHNFDMSGAQYSGIGPFSPGTIRHIERRGGAPIDEDQVPTNIGFENLTLQNVGPEFMNEASYGTITWQNHFNTWTTDMRFGKWPGHSQQIKGARHLDLSNNFFGEVWRNRCTGAIASLAATDPIQITVSSVSIGNQCEGTEAGPGARWGSGNEPTVWLPASLADNADPVVAGLADKMFAYTCIDCDASDNSVTVTLANFVDGTDYDGSALVDTTPSEGYVVLLNQFGVAKNYFKGDEIQQVNASYFNVRIGVIYQSGANANVNAYGVFETGGLDVMCGRSLFIHGGYASAMLWEGFVADCGYVTAAVAETGSPIGPNATFYRNRHVWRGASTHALNEACGGEDRGWCQERYDNQGKSSDTHNYVLNFTGGWNHTSVHLGSSNNSGDFGGPPLEPWGLSDPFVGSNVWHSQTMTERVGTSGGGTYENATNNPTFPDANKPDLAIERDGGVANSNVPTAPTAWDSRVHATSIFYNSVQAEPSWWCEESGTIALGTFPGVGADFDDLLGTLSILPAERRRRGLPCTAVAAPTWNPATRMGGAVTIGAGVSF